VIEREGPERAHFLLETLNEQARRSGAHIPFNPSTACLNTISPAEEERSPGEADMEWRTRSLVHWNALAMVVKANKVNAGIGGHIASFASATTLYDVGFVLTQ
jgi:pyruvate dehydrogenase E1 component